MLGSAISTARELGELHPDTEPAQLAFELYAAMELANYLSTLHRDPAFVERDGRRSGRLWALTCSPPGRPSTLRILPG